MVLSSICRAARLCVIAWILASCSGLVCPFSAITSASCKARVSPSACGGEEADALDSVGEDAVVPAVAAAVALLSRCTTERAGDDLLLLSLPIRVAA